MKGSCLRSWWLGEGKPMHCMKNCLDIYFWSRNLSFRARLGLLLPSSYSITLLTSFEARSYGAMLKILFQATKTIIRASIFMLRRDNHERRRRKGGNIKRDITKQIVNSHNPHNSTKKKSTSIQGKPLPPGKGWGGGGGWVECFVGTRNGSSIIILLSQPLKYGLPNEALLQKIGWKIKPNLEPRNRISVIMLLCQPLRYRLLYGILLQKVGCKIKRSSESTFNLKLTC